ncbi:ABC transporter ATP-binding protein [Flavobacteriaceae bacterium 14752]|uniref:ABC transporter ATP-binding protein n=1 Tax=Mesohalobacter salilacus TaxID=2491711 RepID=UPI000F63B20D|nr:ATP-binding cassette domain-containing protein [Flavobacteriaceae bacterium 14752]
MSEAFLRIKQLHKWFGQNQILKNINLDLSDGQTLSLIGASGSGKTTLLKIIAGLENANQGQIYLRENRIDALSPQQRKIIYLYQDALLFPHLSAFENIAFGLRLQKAKHIPAQVNAMLDKLGMQDQGHKMPNQLSGGQKQRIAFGRALVIQPQLLLLDEPFGALDPEIRSHMQKLFKTLVSSQNLSAIFVTHDLKEAIIIGDNIAKIEQGSLIQYDSKKAFYQDDKSGVNDEILFWKHLKNETNED